jgi:hypothetical protein
MLDAVGAVLPLAVAIALSPLAIASVVLMLLSSIGVGVSVEATSIAGGQALAVIAGVALLSSIPIMVPVIMSLVALDRISAPLDEHRFRLRLGHGHRRDRRCRILARRAGARVERRAEARRAAHPHRARDDEHRHRDSGAAEETRR